MSERFGERVRRLRKERSLGLRETALKIGISAAYLSRVETNEEKNPPAEEVIRKLATILGDNFDDLMQLAGRIPSDVADFIKSAPGLPAFLRTAREMNMSGQELDDLVRQRDISKAGR